MRNFIVSSKLFRDKYGVWNSTYDEDIQKFLNLLNLKIYPFLQNKGKISKSFKNADGLLLLGGGDLYKYDKKEENRLRDNIEKKLFKYFFRSNKPIIGICRGFQMIMDIYGVQMKKGKGHIRKFHNLKLESSRFLKLKNSKVNYYHNYIVEELPINFNIVSKMKDGSIEISEHKHKKILCFMFHPERKMKSQKKLISEIKKFLK